MRSHLDGHRRRGRKREDEEDEEEEEKGFFKCVHSSVSGRETSL